MISVKTIHGMSAMISAKTIHGMSVRFLNPIFVSCLAEIIKSQNNL